MAIKIRVLSKKEINAYRLSMNNTKSILALYKALNSGHYIVMVKHDKLSSYSFNKLLDEVIKALELQYEGKVIKITDYVDLSKMKDGIVYYSFSVK